MTTHNSFTVLGAAVLLVIIFLVAFGFNAMATLTVVLFPMYGSLVALKTQNVADDRQWLSYWVIFGAFSAVESITSFFAEKIPLYTLLRTAFFVVCYLPNIKLASKIFAVLDPHLAKLIGNVDAHKKDDDAPDAAAANDDEDAGDEDLNEGEGEANGGAQLPMD
jgi:receptor expression-enhancing protein 5/6